MIALPGVRSYDGGDFVEQADAFVPFHVDNGFTNRDSTVHVFLAGKHLYVVLSRHGGFGRGAYR